MHDLICDIDYSCCKEEIIKKIDAKLGNNKSGLYRGNLTEIGRFGKVLLDIYDEGKIWKEILDE